MDGTLEDVLDLRDPTARAMLLCSECLQDKEADPWDVAGVFEKLREWLRRDVAVAQNLLSKARIQPLVVLALRRHKSNLEVARHGCGAIAGMCQRSNQNAAEMQKAGLVQCIFDLMDEYRMDGILQDNACIALWRISERGAGGAEEITKMGGIAKLFRALKEHVRNPFVQVNACIAMEHIFVKGGAPADGMQEAAEQAMRLHPANTQIKRSAERLLNVLRNPPADRNIVVAKPLLETPKGSAFQAKEFERNEKLAAPATNSKAKPAGVQLSDAQTTRIERLAVPMHEWLMELDSVGFLMGYLVKLKQNFDSLAQIVEWYAPEGELDPKFFEDVNVQKLGHRRLFEKWCRDTLRPDRTAENI